MMTPLLRPTDAKNGAGSGTFHENPMKWKKYTPVMEWHCWEKSSKTICQKTQVTALSEEVEEEEKEEEEEEEEEAAAAMVVAILYMRRLQAF